MEIVQKENTAKVAEFEIEVQGEKGTFKCLLCKPNRNTLAEVFSTRAAGKVLEAGEIILENCWVDGSEIILEDEDMKAAASLAAIDAIKLPTATLKKIPR